MGGGRKEGEGAKGVGLKRGREKGRVGEREREGEGEFGEARGHVNLGKM